MLSGVDPVVGVPATVLDFWRYAMPNRQINNVRGDLAEFLVGQAVGSGRTVRASRFEKVMDDGFACGQAWR